MSTGGFYDALGMDDGGLPVHLPMEVTKGDDGPAGPEDMHHLICWCGQEMCPLNRALHAAWLLGQASTFPLLASEVRPGVAHALRNAADRMVLDPAVQTFLRRNADELDSM